MTDRNNTEALFTTKEKAEQAQPNLPPAGAAREEVLAERTDNLAEAAENRGVEQGAIPESFMEPDQEIQNHIHKNYLAIGVDHPFLKTRWVNYVNQHGTKVWEAKSEGWQVATPKEFPEAKHFVREDNTIRVGDVILMFIRIDLFLQIEKEHENARLRQQFGLENDVHDIAAKYPNVFKNVHTESSGTMPANIQQKMESRAASNTAAQKIAAQHLGNQMRRGTIPGVPIPGAKS